MEIEQKIKKTCLNCKKTNNDAKVFAWANFCGKCQIKENFSVICNLCKTKNIKLMFCSHSPIENWQKICCVEDCLEPNSLDNAFCINCGTCCNFSFDFPISTNDIQLSITKSTSNDCASSSQSGLSISHGKRVIDSVESISPESESSSINKFRPEVASTFCDANDAAKRKSNENDLNTLANKSKMVENISEVGINGSDDANQTVAGSGDVTKTDAGSGDATKTDAGLGDATKTDAGSGDATKTDAGSDDATKTDAGSGDATKTDAGSGDVTKTDAGSGDATKTDAGSGDATKTDAGSGDATKTDAGSGDATKTDASSGDATKTDAGSGDVTKTDAGSSDATKTDAGSGDATKTDAGSGDATKTDAGLGDTKKTDAGSGDATKTDAGSGDATKTDAGSGDATKTDAGLGDTTKTDAGSGDVTKTDAGSDDAKNLMKPEDKQDLSPDSRKRSTNSNFKETGPNASKSSEGNSPSSSKRSRSETKCLDNPSIPESETDVPKTAGPVSYAAAAASNSSIQQSDQSKKLKSVIPYGQFLDELRDKSEELICVQFYCIAFLVDLQRGHLEILVSLPCATVTCTGNFCVEPINENFSRVYGELFLPRSAVLQGQTSYRYYLKGTRIETRSGGSDLFEVLPANLANNGRSMRPVFSLRSDVITQLDGQIFFGIHQEPQQLALDSLIFCFNYAFGSAKTPQERLSLFQCLLKSTELNFVAQHARQFVLISVLRRMLPLHNAPGQSTYQPISKDGGTEQQQWQQWITNLELLHFATLAKAAPFLRGALSLKGEELSSVLECVLPPETPSSSLFEDLIKAFGSMDAPMEATKAWFHGMLHTASDFHPNYLLILPAYHILTQGESQAGEVPLRQAIPPLLKPRANPFVWCGLGEKFVDFADQCGSKIHQAAEILETKLMRYCLVDPLMPRCYAMLKRLRLFDAEPASLELVPASAKLAVLGHCLAQARGRDSFDSSLPHQHSVFCNFYNTLSVQLESSSSPLPVAELQLCLELHCETFKILCRNISEHGRKPLSKHANRPSDTISCLLAAVNLTITLCNVISDDGAASGATVVGQIKLLETDVFRSEDKGDTATVKLMSQLFGTLKSCKPSLAEPCCDALDKLVACLLYKSDLDSVFSLMEGTKLETDRLKSSVSSVAVDKITHVSSSKDGVLRRIISRIFSTSNESLKKIGQLSLVEFNQQESGPTKALKFSLTWKLCQQITCHEDYKKLKTMMEKDFAGLLKQCLSAVRQTLKELCQGPQATPLETAKLLISKKAELLEYHRELQHQNRLKGFKANESQLQSALGTFERQISAIDSGVDQLRHFVGLCADKLNPSFCDLDSVRKALASFQRKRIGELTLQEDKNWLLKLAAFGIDERHRALLGDIRASKFFSDSASFVELLQANVRGRYCRQRVSPDEEEELSVVDTNEPGDMEMSVEQVLDADALLDVIQETKVVWNRQVKLLKDEDMTVEAARKFLGEEMFRDAKKLKAELKISGLSDENINGLSRKIHFIQSKAQNDRLCAALCSIYKNYEMNMDEQLKDLTEAEATAGELKFKDIRISKLEANEIIKDMLRVPMLLEVLDAFAKAHELVKWTRKNLKKDDLKTFFDLAMIYTGDGGAMEQGKIECFYQAVVGFEPLIYDLLSRDGQVRLIHIKEASSRVLKSCQVCKGACQPNTKDCQNYLLVRHLNDSSDWVDWLQEVNSSKGTVERSTVSRVKAVTTVGMLRVRAADPTEFSLKIDNRTLTLEDVQDLQSKLMLIIGQSDEDQEMFNAFIELTNLFARLVSLCDGLGSDCCPLFEDLTVEAVLKQGSLDNLTLKLNPGLRPQPDCFTVADAIDGIRQSVEFLVACRDEWLKRVAAERRERPILNLFGARQLRFLQTHLADQLLKQDQPSPKLLHLLRFAVPDVGAHEAAVALRTVLGHAADCVLESPSASTRVAASSPSSAAGVAEVLMPVWKSFLDGTSADIDSFRSLSFDQVAQFLNNLAAIRPTLSIPPALSLNLPPPGLTSVSVPEGQQLLACLDTFRLAFDRLPLPTEVLCCSRRTEREELRLFLDRALDASPAGHRESLFVLLWAERLPYELSCYAESRLTQLLNQRSSGMTAFSSRLLAVLTDAGRRSGGPLCAALGHYLHDAVRVPSEREVTAWACSQLGHGQPTTAQVTLVTSARPGMGKSLRCRRLSAPMKPQIFSWHSATFEPDRLYDFLASVDAIEVEGATHRVFHLDIAREVRDDLDEAIAQLLIFGALRSSKGFIWRRSPNDVFLLEHSPLRPGALQSLRFLPTVRCITPAETLSQLRSGAVRGLDGRVWDEESLTEDWFQRPARHLLRKDASAPLPAVTALEALTNNCGLLDPSWLELATFCRFLDRQLCDFEESAFCSAAAQEDLPGFRQFVVDSMLLMAKDFATRSLRIADESANVGTGRDAEEDNAPERIEQFALRRHWEDEDHPYLFFNHDCTFSFVGFSVDLDGNLIGQATRQTLRSRVMAPQLVQALIRNRAPLSDNFEGRSRADKLECLRRILGSANTDDPDPTYELTADNARKMLAVYMRFRCCLPVVVMGETGCGKTRLVRFLARLMLPQGVDGVDNMLVLKVHGGTTERSIEDAVRRAERLGRKNSRLVPGLITILFFDEVNSTNAVGLIKEVMCDRRLHGRPVDPDGCLRFVAACNPYRRHTDEMIDRLESSGLGYRVRKEDTTDRFGDLPMRHLVYRVRPMPLSLVSLLWDFGSLSSEAEGQYALRMLKSGLPAAAKSNASAVAGVLCESQRFMRGFSDESRFVSLREVDKALRVMNWALGYDRIHRDSRVNKITCALIVTMSVCYLSRLSAACKPQYIRLLATQLQRHACFNSLRPVDIEELLQRCQEVFISEVPLPPGISKNGALRENVFMMVVCISLRLPLFLVGKPGSSKSLAKTIVRSRMLGRNSASEAYKDLPNTHMLAFQCSPWSTSDGIIQTFQQCAKLQKGKRQDEFVAVVVLEEVGLAEDSPDMPLKSLHPLLEDGCIDEAGPVDEDGEESLPPECRKVAFVGISNWALDPAKMNRGLYVQRDVPDRDELVATARGICSGGQGHDWGRLAEFYLKIHQTAFDRVGREFFGLRDFFSLVKDLRRSTEDPNESLRCAAKNFGGLEEVDPVTEFLRLTDGQPADRHRALSKLVLDAALETRDPEERYLLLVTQNLAGFKALLRRPSDRQATVIFGSSFPHDQLYTKVCRDINKIKLAMERGETVVLMNMDSLYESLYDVLNQYYETCGGQRYVDLGLGTHRLKCKIHENFRIVVVADRDTVMDRFPIPLINRMEKRRLCLDSLLTPQQKQLCQEIVSHLQDELLRAGSCSGRANLTDVLIGYHDDSVAALLLELWPQPSPDAVGSGQAVDEASDLKLRVIERLMLTASPDCYFRLDQSSPLLATAVDPLTGEFRPGQSLAQRLRSALRAWPSHRLLQVTSFDQLMSESDCQQLAADCPELGGLVSANLSSFETEGQFSDYLRAFLGGGLPGQTLLLQLDVARAAASAGLVASAKHCIEGAVVAAGAAEPLQSGNRRVLLCLRLRRSHASPFRGFESGDWLSMHADSAAASVALRVQGLAPAPASTIVQRLSSGQPADDLPVTFDLDHLVHSSLLAALAQLGGGSGSSSAVDRCSQRFNIFVGAYHADSEFRALVLEFLWRGLEFIEANCSFIAYEDCAQWLRHEAAQLGAVLQSGTFAESIWRALCRKATPVLAAFLSLADRHRGFDALSAAGDGWRRRLWLRLARVFLTPDTGFSASTAACVALSRFAQPTGSPVGGSSGAEEAACQLPFAAELLSSLNQLRAALAGASLDCSASWADQLMAEFPGTPAGAALDDCGNPGGVAAALAGDLLLLSRAILDAEAGEDTRRLVADVLERQARADAAAAGPEQPARLAAAVWAASVEWRDCLRLSAALMARADGLAASVADAGEAIRRCCELPLAALEHFQLGFTRSTMVAALTDRGRRSAWTCRVRDCGPAVENLLAYLSQQSQLPREASAEARAAWQRLQCLQLFLDTVSLPFDAEASVPDGLIQPVQLWNSFLANPHASFKTVTAIRLIEAFLTQTDNDIASSLTCCVCDEPEQGGDSGGPQHLLLACGHRVCRDCSGLPQESEESGAADDAASADEADQDDSDEHEEIQEQIADPVDGATRVHCPVCQESAVAAAAAVGATGSVRADFRARCNAFMMEAAARLTFGGGPEPPDAELCRHLVAYVTACDGGGGPSETKEFAYFTQNRDPSPVFRSFILQQLLRYSRESVQQQLTEHLASARAILGADAAVDLACIVCHCLEDLRTAHLAKQERADTRLKLALADLQSELKDQPLADSLDELTALATARAALTVLADALAQDEGRLAADKPDRPATVAGKNLKASRQARIFLLRSLANRLGAGGAVRLLRQHRWLGNIFGDELEGGGRGEASQPELLLCHSESFRAAREAIWQLVLGVGDRRPACDQQLQSLAAASVVNQLQAMQPRPASLGDVEPQLFVSQLLPGALDSRFGRRLLELLEFEVPGQPPEVRHQLRSLLLHAAHLAATARPGQSSLLDFFRQLPARASDWFLPGMPHDLVFEAVQAIRARPTEGENPTLYLCPNGHPYVITECGRPWTRGRCNTCHQPIGGASHNADPGNQKQLDQPDQSRRGFLEELGDGGGWRGMTGGFVAALRLLQGLFLVSSSACQSSPSPEQLSKDLARLARALGRSTEAASQLLHILLARLAAHADGGGDWRDLGEQAGRQRLERSLLTSDVMMQGRLETESAGPLAEAARLSATDSVGVISSLLTVACGGGGDAEDCQLWRWREPLTVAGAAALCPPNGLVLTAQAAGPALLHLPRLPALLRLAEQLAADPIVAADAVRMTKRSRQPPKSKPPVFLARLAKQRPELAEPIAQLQAAWRDLRHLLVPELDGLDPKLAKTPAEQLPAWMVLPRSGGFLPGLLRLLCDAQNRLIEASRDLLTDSAVGHAADVFAVDAGPGDVADLQLERDLPPLILRCRSYALGGGGSGGAIIDAKLDVGALERLLADSRLRSLPRLRPGLGRLSALTAANSAPGHGDSGSVGALMLRLLAAPDVAATDEQRRQLARLADPDDDRLPSELPALTGLAERQLPAAARLADAGGREPLRRQLEAALPNDEALQAAAAASPAGLARLWLAVDLRRWTVLAGEGQRPFDEFPGAPLATGESAEPALKLGEAFRQRRQPLMRALHQLVTLWLAAGDAESQLLGLPLAEVADYLEPPPPPQLKDSLGLLSEAFADRPDLLCSQAGLVWQALCLEAWA